MKGDAFPLYSMADMQSIDDVLAQVQRRMRWQRAARAATLGSAAGSAVGLLLALSWALMPPSPAAPFLTAPTMLSLGLLPLLFGFAFGLIAASVASLRSPSRIAAALLVDRYYGMKDRTLSAIEFLEKDDQDAMRAFQIADTQLHLRKVRVEDCVPIELPRAARNAAVACCVAAVGIAALTQFDVSPAVASSPLPLATRQAARLRQTVLPEIARLAKEADDNAEELRELTEQLESLVDELERPGQDQRDVMATLSDMEQVITAARDALEVAVTEADLKQVAGALTSADALRDAAEAMEAGDFEQAATELEAFDPAALSEKERRAVANDLEETAKELAEHAQENLAKAAEEIQQGLAEQDASQTKQGMQRLADINKQQSRNQKVANAMNSQLNQLAQSKGEARGDRPGDSDNKSDQASDKWGKGTAGKPDEGPATKLDAVREEQKLGSQIGEGDGETERVEDLPQEQQAARQYAKQYHEYRRQAEAVLDQEPLPLGHRETIREYFESIRPTRSDEAPQP